LSAQVKEILAKLVAFDTTSRNSNRACVDFIRDYLKGLGVKSKIIASDDGSKACLWATIGMPSKNGIVFAGHTDTVPVDGQKWTSDPFTLIERGGKYYGRGTADMKGFIACVLAVIPDFLAAKTDACFHLALTYDEEISMAGAVRLTDALIAKKIKPDWVWVGEPTGLSLIDRHKGCAIYRTRITGVPGHSSQPDKGLNAIDMMREFMNAVTDIARKRKAGAIAGSAFDPPYTTINLGTVKGGTAENIIAENCELVWQVRVHPGDSAEAVCAEVESAARALFASRFAVFPQAKMNTDVDFYTPPYQTKVDNSGIKTLQRLLKDKKTHAAGFATEAGIFQKLGADVVICGPGFTEQAHQPDEFVYKKQLTSCVDLMRQVLLSSSARKKSPLKRSMS
jgi:acetylornithine deacetylase